MGIQQDKLVLASVSTELNKLNAQMALVKEAVGRELAKFNGITTGINAGEPQAIRGQIQALQGQIDAVRQNMAASATKVNQYAVGLGR